MIQLTDDVWQVQTPHYIAFIYTKDLAKFVDAWEQNELAKISFLQEATLY